MEKRTIIAFVLSFLVLLIWSSLYGPGKERSSTVEEERSTKAPGQIADRPESPTAREMEPRFLSEKASPPQIPMTKIEETQISVDTPLYQAVFTNMGPTVRSFRLKKFHQTTDPNSPRVELVNFPKDLGNFFQLSFIHAGSSQNQSSPFIVDRENLRISEQDSPKQLVFKSTTPEGLAIEQSYTFYPDQYRIDVLMEIFNPTGERVTGNLAAELSAYPPKEKKSYYSYVGLILLINDRLEEAEIEESSEQKTLEGEIQWMAYEDDYFISALSPPANKKSGAFIGRLLPSGVLLGKYSPSPLTLAPSERFSSQWALYIGPREISTLKTFGNDLYRAVDFGYTDIIAKPLLYVLRFFNQYIKNYGVSIVLLTILVKILFWPLTHKSYKSMKEMQKLQPRMAKLREKYKGNREQLNREMMALYKTYKVNPMSGCLPMLIQLPVFFALFRILGSAIELRHAPFMLWINDLSAPDRLFSLPFAIPFMKPPYGIPVLTLLMGASMFIQQKMTPTPGDPMQAKVMMFLPVIFTFMFINFPSGLVLYWFTNNILSIGQQYRIHKSAV
jgi:YidC/Oxa1 family membrane protein insertase